MDGERARTHKQRGRGRGQTTRANVPQSCKARQNQHLTAAEDASRLSVEPLNGYCRLSRRFDSKSVLFPPAVSCGSRLLLAPVPAADMRSTSIICSELADPAPAISSRMRLPALLVNPRALARRSGVGLTDPDAAAPPLALIRLLINDYFVDDRPRIPPRFLGARMPLRGFMHRRINPKR